LPVTLLYQQEGLTHSKALIREAQIKAMPRSKKEEIILNIAKRYTSADG
jgi:predicted GIY-YIG superfamily endonuclease